MVEVTVRHLKKVQFSSLCRLIRFVAHYCNTTVQLALANLGENLYPNIIKHLINDIRYYIVYTASLEDNKVELSGAEMKQSQA
jgi:hypothetical protein